MVLLAVPLFALLPRIRTPYLMVRGTGTGTIVGAAGFSDLITLDSIGAARGSRQVLLRLRVPSALPYFFAGLRVASGLALIGAIVAEFVAGTGGTAAGLAYQILLAGIRLDIPRLFAALVLITLAGVVLYLVVSALGRFAIGRWHESELVPER